MSNSPALTVSTVSARARALLRESEAMAIDGDHFYASQKMSQALSHVRLAIILSSPEPMMQLALAASHGDDVE